jgi:hypothetical protein
MGTTGKKAKHRYKRSKRESGICGAMNSQGCGDVKPSGMRQTINVGKPTDGNIGMV